MATKIVTKNSSTASAVPTASDLVQGELAVNVADKRLFTEDNAGAIVELGTNPSALTVTGEITANGGIALGDNDKATFGASDDLQIYHTGSDSIIQDTGTGNLKIQGSDIRINNADSSKSYISATDGGSLLAYHNGLEKISTTATGIDVTGNMISDGVGIGTSSPSAGIDVVKTGSVTVGNFETDGNSTVTIKRTGASATTSSIIASSGGKTTLASSGYTTFDTSGSERLRIDASGNTIFTKAGGAYLQLKDASAVRGAINVTTSDGLIFTTGASFTERMRISGSNVGIGTSSPAKLLHLSESADGAKLRITRAGVSEWDFSIGNTSTLTGVGAGALEILPQVGGTSNELAIGTAGSAVPLVHITNSQNYFKNNLLVGKTASNSTVAGAQLNSNGLIIGTTSETNPLLLNRLSTDGAIAVFQKAGAAVGSIGVNGGDLYIENGITGISFNNANNALLPTTTGGVVDDANQDLGISWHRFRNLYRSGSTISTSDRNMKQDIRDLTDAERNVAVAAKGLLKAFRFIDRVEEEGDSANIHFGIIAQDLAAAFTAEGLDAKDYQVYRADTFTDDDGNEQTRLGICYENLLAFIISAI